MAFLIDNILERLSSISSSDFKPDNNSLALDPSKHEAVDSFRIEKQKGCC